MKNFLIAGVKRGSDSRKKLQGSEPETLSDFYTQVEPFRLVEESMADWKKDLDYRRQDNWGKNKCSRSYSPKGRDLGYKSSVNGTSSARSTGQRAKPKVVAEKVVTQQVPNGGISPYRNVYT